jgi:hypothetical protein
METIADSWDSFRHEWCLDVDPGYDQAYAVRALQALEALWPEVLAELHGSGGRGIGAVGYPIHLGSALADTRECAGFESVLRRARKGERSALSELQFAAKCQRAGFKPDLDVEIGGKRLDLAVTIDGMMVYVEVVTPDKSDLDKDAYERVARARDMFGPREGEFLKVELLTFPFDDVVAAVRAGIERSALGESAEIPGVARWRRERPADGGSRGEFSWPSNEYRAERLISSEYHHFAAPVPYILVVNVSATLMTPEGWSAAFGRAFQPGRNRKLGATVAYQDYVAAADFRWGSSMAFRVNPHATYPVPQRLILALESMHRPLLAAAT